MFDVFPREVAKKKRKIIYNTTNLLGYINRNNTFTDIHITVYGYEETEERNNKQRCRYESAILDKVFFDFDEKDAYKDTLKLHEWCKENNIQHSISFSGRGYHLYIFLKGNIQHKKSCLTNIHKHFVALLNLDLDKHIIGDLARFTRMVNTYNLKRKKWCIPLTQTQFLKGDEYIRELATKQNIIKWQIIGRKKFDTKQFDIPPSMDYLDEFDIDYKNLKLSAVPDLLKRIQLPYCIHQALEDLKTDKKSWKKRYYLILFLREKGFLLEETIAILKHYLPSAKFRHMIFDENNQPKYIYSRPDLFFPNHETLKREGFCKWKNCKMEVYK